MQPWVNGADTLVCQHWKVFPPPLAFFDEEAARSNPQFKVADWQRFDVYKRVCGLKEMGAKCLSCPLVRKVIVKPPLGVHLAHLDGSNPVPLVDAETQQVLARKKL